MASSPESSTCVKLETSGMLFVVLLLIVSIKPGAAQVVTTVSPPIFNDPLYRNPSDFPGAVPLIPPIGSPAPISQANPAGVSDLSNVVDVAPTAPMGIDMLSPRSRPEQPLDKPKTAARIGQLTAPEVPVALQSRTDAHTQQPSFLLSSPGVGTEPLLQSHPQATVLSSARLNPLPRNSSRLSREQPDRGDAIPPPVAANSAPRAIAFESSSFTKRDPLSPEALSRNSLQSVPGLAFKAKSTTSLFAFHPYAVSGLHMQNRRHSPSMPTPAQSSGLAKPLHTVTLPDSHGAQPRMPRAVPQYGGESGLLPR
jgi:hypothetical protein